MPPVEKPEFLSPQQAAAFEERDVAASYKNRAEYPDAVFEVLEALIGSPGPILDIGCGTGFLARPLAQRAHRVDAVDISAAMVDAGKRSPGGAAENLHWQVAAFEQAQLEGPYALIVAGESLHWMDWSIALPRCRDLLLPGAKLAIVEHRSARLPWQDELSALIARFSTSPGFRPFDTPRELSARHLFIEEGRTQTPPARWVQRIEDYIDSFHARAALTRTRMGAAATRFDAAIQSMIRRSGHAEVAIDRVCEIVWGSPA